MAYDRNGHYCSHNLIDYDKDTNEYYCEDCGEVVEEPDDDEALAL